MKIALLIHGPLSNNALQRINLSLNNVNCINRIDIVSYKLDKSKLLDELSSLNNLKEAHVVLIKDLINPGFYNINRQISCVAAGLRQIPNDFFVIKLRIDQVVDFDKLINIIKNNYELLNSGKIITTNCFTRVDRLYHPSDMFLAGRVDVLRSYYSAPLMDETHSQVQMQIMEETETHKGKCLYGISVCPESYLFRCYLKVNGWAVKNTQEDSYLALKKYFIIVNTWDVELRWAKYCNWPFKHNFQIVLPHTFLVEPFEGAPLESAKCYSRSDFYGEKTFKDRFYLFSSLLRWKLWVENQDGPYWHYKIKNLMIKEKIIFQKKAVIQNVFKPLPFVKANAVLLVYYIKKLKYSVFKKILKG